MKRQRSIVAAAAALTLALVSIPASAHITPNTYGSTYTAGATNVFYLRVPHSCADPDTTNSPGGTSLTSQIVVDVPSTLVTSVKPQFIPGWTLSTVKSGTGAVTQITWTASSNAFALPDTSFQDFGIRASLVGKAGDKIGLPTHQHCNYHENGTAASLLDEWIGADTPTLTLVANDQGVNSAANVAELKSGLTDVKTKVSGQPATDDQLKAQIAYLLGLLDNATKGNFAASRTASGALTVSVDLSAVNRGRKVGINVNGRNVGTKVLNAAGDLAATFPKAKVPAGATVRIVLGGTVVATATV